MDIEQSFLNKIDNKEPLTEKEFYTLIIEYAVDIKYGENRRWSRTNRTIIQLKNRFFAIIWEQGLTEYQPDEFTDYPVEVEKKEYKKIITVYDWVEKEVK